MAVQPDDVEFDLDDDTPRPRHGLLVRWTAILIVASFVAAAFSAVLINL